MPDKRLGEALRWYREAAGLSRAEAAEKLSVSYSSIRNWELGFCAPRNIRDLPKILGISPANYTRLITGLHNQADTEDVLEGRIC